MDASTPSDTLSPKQRKAILALLVHADVASAAKSVSIGRSTLHHWLQQPAFVNAVEAARARQTADALDLLQATLLNAITKARALLNSESEAVALRTAQLLIEHGLKDRADRMQRLDLKTVMDIQSQVVTVVLDTLSELGFDTPEARKRISHRMSLLAQSGWPINPALTETSNGVPQ